MLDTASQLTEILQPQVFLNCTQLILPVHLIASGYLLMRVNTVALV